MATTIASTSVIEKLQSIELPNLPAMARDYAVAIAENIAMHVRAGLYESGIAAEEFLTVARVTLHDLKSGCMLDFSPFSTTAIVKATDDLYDMLDDACVIPIAAAVPYPMIEILAHEERMHGVLSKTNLLQMGDITAEMAGL